MINDFTRKFIHHIFTCYNLTLMKETPRLIIFIHGYTKSDFTVSLNVSQKGIFCFEVVSILKTLFFCRKNYFIIDRWSFFGKNKIACLLD